MLNRKLILPALFLLLPSICLADEIEKSTATVTKLEAEVLIDKIENCNYDVQISSIIHMLLEKRDEETEQRLWNKLIYIKGKNKRVKQGRNYDGYTGYTELPDKYKKE